MRRILNVVWVAAATMGVAGCTDYESATQLRPEGPPMIRQVRLMETYTLGNSTTTARRVVFAFGEHEMATADVQHEVTSATALGNKLRIIMDELLVGNRLEEIACRGSVDEDGYQRVPDGATPDDVARCSVPQDVLPQTCTGETAVCICQNDAGCSVGGASVIEKGQPVGVLDVNQDGSADDTRFIAGAVGIRCGTIDVPIDLDASYWYPSGNQQVPATGGFDALGPAIVLVPRGPLPTGLACQLAFADDVVDKQGLRVCAPPGGDVEAGCEPGDVSAFQFTVEALSFISEPADMSTGVLRTEPVLFVANTHIDEASLTGFVVENVTAGTMLVEGTGFTVGLSMNRNVSLSWTDPLEADTEYRITVPTTVTDTFGQGMPAPLTITFTTDAN